MHSTSCTCTVLKKQVLSTGPPWEVKVSSASDLEEQIIRLEKVVIEILSVFKSMPEVGNWRVEEFQDMIEKIKDKRGWI